MAKRIVNKAERNAERYDAKETGYQLYEDSLKGNKFDRLMPLIVSEQNIILAYRNICKNNGSKTPGTDGKTIVEIQSLPIETVIKTVRNKLNFYQPKKVRRVEIPKDNGKTRPLGIPSIWDRLIQQCILQILEPICEAKFHERNNGFRPYRSTQNAIAQCYKMAQLQNLHFVVDVDIVGFFDNIDHNVMIGILRKRIKDERFLRLIRKFLNAGYMEDNQVHQSYSGTPQGGIISPILANIYLDQFDKYMAEFKKRFDRGNKRAVNVEYRKLSDKRIRLKRKLAKAKTEEEKQSLLESIWELDKVHKSIPCKDPMDENFRRLQYVRYADDFLIGIIGAKEDAQAVKQEIGTYIAGQLKLELSDEKTLVTKATDRAKFLGFEIRVTPQSNHTKKTKSGSTARNYSGHVMLEVPTSAIQKKLLELGAMRIDVRNGTEIWQPTHRGKLVGRTDLSILDQYNGEIRGFCNYYAIANNRSKLHKFRYIMEYSFYKTLACKYRTTKRKIIVQYRIGKDIGVKFQDKHGKERIRLLWQGSLARDPYPLGKEADIIHKPKGILKKPSLGARLKANRCEWCGKETSVLVMHQVRTLKELDESQPWAAFMKKINRKTLVVCESCHTKIHSADCE